MKIYAFFLLSFIFATSYGQEKVSVKSPSSSTLKGDQWTPSKDSSGNITQAEWDGLPLNRWIEVMATSLESQLSAPYGAASGYKGVGSGPTEAHYDNYTGMGWDEKNGRAYHFGGGHAGGSNNMLTSFDLAKGKHTVEISPTHQSMYPESYIKSQSLSQVIYPNGKQYLYFPSTESPAGDDKPCASHEWQGIVYVPGINEVLLPRFGWFHAQLDSKKWRVGPQTIEADRKGFKNRGGVGFQCYFIPKTGLVYLTSEGGQISDNAGYFSIVKYDPVKRVEVGVIGWDAGNCGSSCLAGDFFWFFQGEQYGDSALVSTVDLVKETSIRGRTKCIGRLPKFKDTDGDNPSQYIPELDKILMLCSVGRQDGAQVGEMLDFDRTTFSFSTFPIAGTPPAIPRSMNNKMRYWPTQKVLLIQLTTSANAWVIKLAKK